MKNSTVMTKANIRMLASILPEVSSDERAGIVGEVLPEQFYTPAQESHERWTGERGLMLAVLEEAVHSYLKYRNSTTRRGRRLFAETQAWFWSDDQEYLFAFENICTYLQLDPNYVRRGLEGIAQLPATTFYPTGRSASLSTHDSSRFVFVSLSFAGHEQLKDDKEWHRE